MATPRVKSRLLDTNIFQRPDFYGLPDGLKYFLDSEPYLVLLTTPKKVMRAESPPYLASPYPKLQKIGLKILKPVIHA